MRTIEITETVNLKFQLPVEKAEIFEQYLQKNNYTKYKKILSPYHSVIFRVIIRMSETELLIREYNNIK